MYAGLIELQAELSQRNICMVYDTLFFQAPGIKAKMIKMKIKTKGKFALFLAGIGIALIVYNF